MAKEYRYSDAVTLLGGIDPKIKVLDTVLGAATLGMWDLIDAKTEFIRVGNDLLGRWRDWRAGKTWRDRTERLEAAHAIIVVTAFFEVVDSLNLSIKISRDEQTKIAGSGKIESTRLLSVPGCPTAHVPYENTLEALELYYAKLARDFRRFLEGLDFWQSLPEYQRETYQVSGLTDAALRRYQDKYRQLAIDVPEFGFWTNMVEHQATRASLIELEQLLSRISTGAISDGQLESLTRLHKAALQKPIAETGDVPAGMALPSLGEAYITPHFVAKQADLGHNPSLEEWWDSCHYSTDLPGFLAGYLTGSEASCTPLIILGQPGAGKSVLTKVLAARLSDDYLPIRVPLREVYAGADIQEQIEQAIYRLSGERLNWPTLARAANGVLPVVMLDGFDELLQATGARQSDYLQRVAQFQQRELDAGRAVAVIVTSRTAVADRAEFPQGSIVLRLEPFDDEQVRRWLAVWNNYNATYFASSQVEPFTWETAQSQIELARQPLLLMMLAFYEANGNALQHGAKELSRAELYERLMRSFAYRELSKEHPPHEAVALVEKELFRLSVVAFAMFNRGRQWATSAEVDADLSVLAPTSLNTASLRSPLTPSDIAFGRFFFVHQAQALSDGNVLLTFEFLHATFGEFLIARLVSTLLQELVAQEGSIMGVNDDLLCALLSWSTLSSRTPVLNFMHELVRDPTQIRVLIPRLFQSLNDRNYSAYSSYQPTKAGPARRQAYYSANLVLLGLATGIRRASSIIGPPQGSTISEWRSLALLWRSQCTASEWLGLVRAVAVKPTLTYDGDKDLELGLIPLGEAAWEEVSSASLAALDLSDADLLRQSAFSCTDEMLALYAVDPLKELVVTRRQQEAPHYSLRLILEILALRQASQRDRISAYHDVALIFDAIDAGVVLKAVIGDLALASPHDSDVLRALRTDSESSRRLVDYVVRHRPRAR